MFSHFIAFVIGGMFGVGVMCLIAMASDEDDGRW